MSELLHAGALVATAVGTCCVAASGRRAGPSELAVTVLMLAAMADLVLRWNLLAAVWWAAALVVCSLLAVVAPPGRRSLGPAVRSARAMDAGGGILMAALLVLMPGHSTLPAAEQAVHGVHGGSSSAVVWLFVAASVLFAAASIRMGVTMRVPSPDTNPRLHTVRRVAPVAMGLSVLLMAGMVLV